MICHRQLNVTNARFDDFSKSNRTVVKLYKEEASTFW